MRSPSKSSVLALATLAHLGILAPLATVSAAPASVRTEGDVAEYRLGADDKIRVITFGEEALSGEFFVDGAGGVSLPLVGEVTAGGLTAPEFQAKVEDALRTGS